MNEEARPKESAFVLHYGSPLACAIRDEISGTLRVTELDLSKSSRNAVTQPGDLLAFIYVMGSSTRHPNLIQHWLEAVRQYVPKVKTCGRILGVVPATGRYRSSYFVLENPPADTAFEAAASAAIQGTIRELALQLSPRLIRANSVVYGLLEAAPQVEVMSETERRYLFEEISLGRLGQPREVAKVVSFLLGKGGNYITGDAIDVNGGWWMS